VLLPPRGCCRTMAGDASGVDKIEPCGLSMLRPILVT
jgi:hypothetical protein